MQIYFNTIKYNPILKKSSKNVITTNPFIQKEDRVEISFRANDYCSPKNFQVKNLANLHCPACGLVMLTEDQVGEYVNDVGEKKGKALIDALEKYEDESVITGKPSKDKTGFGIYRPYKKSVVDVYIQLAKEHPNQTLLGLTKIQAQKSIEKLIAQQLEVVKELEQYIEAEYEGNQKENLLKKLEEYTKQIKGEKQETFARQKFIFGMKKGLDLEHATQMDAITTKMPTSENDINSFFVQYSRVSSPKDIAKKFVQQSTPTAEHIVPRAKGGSDSLSNYICDCSDCNQRRGTTSFYDWLQELPGFQERLQTYINDVRIAIDSNKLDAEYDSYIENVIDTLLDVSEGEVILDIPEVTNPEKKQIVINRRQRQIDNLRSKHGSLISIRNQIADEIAKLKTYSHYEETNKYRKNLEELERIVKEREDIGVKLKSLRMPLFNAKKLLEELEAKVESTKEPASKIVLKTECEKQAREVGRQEGLIKELEQRDNELRKRVITIRVQNKNAAQREELLNRNCTALGMVKSRIEELEDKISKAGNVEGKKEDLVQKIAVCQKEILTLTQIVDSLLNSSFDINDKTKYKEWMHQNELLKAAETISKGKDCSKMSVSLQNAREIIDIAKKAIKAQILQLENEPCVKYFIYMAQIEALTKDEQNYQAKLNAVLALIEEVDSLKAQVATLCKGKTPEEIKKEYELVTNERRVVSDIHAIGIKKVRLERLNEVIEKNEEQFKKLENFENLTNSQYDELISFIEVDELF